MKNSLKTVKASFIFMFVFFSGLFSSCSKNSESPGIETKITTFMEDFSAQIMGLTFDSKGNMYVATYEDQLPKRILKISHDGEISTLISIECFAIENIIADKNDSIYASVIIDDVEGGAKIFKITEDAKMSLFSEGFTQPVGITFDLEDNLFVVDAMAEKVYKINPAKEKSVFIDLGNPADVPVNFYHSIDFDKEYKNLFIAGMNTGGKGNLLKFPINSEGDPGNPIIISNRFSKHVVVQNNVVYATVDASTLLIINEKGSQQPVTNPLLLNAGYLSFGQKEFGESTLYINTTDKIVEVNFVPAGP
jgi:hypothetical protein